MPAPFRSLQLASLVAALLTCAPGPAQAQSTTFRITDLDLRDPHVYVNIIGCRDLTDDSFGGFSFNTLLQIEIEGDGDGDGQLDLSMLLSFMPLACRSRRISWPSARAPAARRPVRTPAAASRRRRSPAM